MEPVHSDARIDTTAQRVTDNAAINANENCVNEMDFVLLGVDFYFLVARGNISYH